MPRLIALLVISLVVISLGAELVVQGAVYIARSVGLSEYAIGATVVAVGTTLPDKAISFIGGIRGQGGVVTSNATGSNIFLLTLVLGLAALVSGSGLAVAPAVTRTDVPILLGVAALVVLLFQRESLHRRTGLALLAIYVVYFVYALLRGI
jgi:cation:H+ antiporter